MLGISLNEQRYYNRVEIDVDAPVRIDINGEDFIDVLSAVDISEGGLGLKVKHRFEGCNLDDLVSMIVQLPAPVSRHFSVMGRIMHISNDSFGVSFVGLSDASRNLVRSYIKSRLD